MKKIILVLFSFLIFAGENNENLVIDEDCCECNCSSTCDIKQLRYFGKQPHVCISDIDNYIIDEKGKDFSKVEHIHICHGEYCDKNCCFTFNEFFGNIEEIKLPDWPVIPSPPPVSQDH